MLISLREGLGRLMEPKEILIMLNRCPRWTELRSSSNMFVERKEKWLFCMRLQS
jgi:hypothetical protein